MKKKIISLAVICICFAIATSGTLAFFTAEGKAHNVITTSGISIQLNEKMMEDGVLVDFPEEGISGIMPGSSASKIVSVENTGAEEAWIRVQVLQSFEDKEGGTLPSVLPDGKSVVTHEVNSDNWTYADGWYYYNIPVASGASTEILFEEVQFAAEMGNQYQNCTAYIDIYAQAVQTANNVIPEDGSVTDVVGWPEEVGE